MYIISSPLPLAGLPSDVDLGLGLTTTLATITGTDIGFYHAFLASLSVIVVSELGDKTWFIATIMAMRHSRITVFCGAMSALALMTVLSATLGWVTHLIPHKLVFYVSTALFAFFGLKMLHEGYHMSPNEGQEEYEEAQAEVQKNELDMESSKFSEMESGSKTSSNSSTWRIISFVSTIFLKSFSLTFVAEWGDRSQLTTILLGARESVAGVILGGILGHAICTGIAVIGGRLLAQRISVRTVTLIGGVVFLLSCNRTYNSQLRHFQQLLTFIC
uniref:GDT1 family protein n=1 Tax=Ditylenchus dipsaci TaxID=166011 RepID=A0A915DMN5_9BILA